MSFLKTAPNGDELREKYAKYLEELATQTRKGSKIPEALFVQFFASDGEIIRHKLYEGGLDLLRTVGAFQCISQEHMNMVMNLVDTDVL